jgi:hypothetical protein
MPFKNTYKTITISKLAHLFQDFVLTVAVPRRMSVGSGPIDNINRTVVNAMSVLTLACRGTVITIAADTIITAQVNADQWVLTSEKMQLG